MKKITKLIIALTLSYLLLVPMTNMVAQANNVSNDPEMRAAWVASTLNINWPSKPGLSIDKQKAEIITIYDNLVSMNLNTVVFQIKPTADAFYPSAYGPWSKYLTGTQDQDPGYDPLEFMVQEAHERGLEFHAWFNPYRLTMAGDSSDIDDLAENHPARSHPDWVMTYGADGKEQLYYNPGLPEVQQFIIDGIMEVVNNYNIDAVHMDDYFYPYPVAGKELPDQATFAEYGGSFTDIGDWRRDNVNTLVKNINNAIKARKANVEFGISPFGVWRNVADDPTGSNTTAGATNYDSLYADTRTWIKQGYIDYMTPQIYWSIGFAAAEYITLVDWWANEVKGTNVKLYIGHGDYKVSDNSDTNWDEPDQMLRQINYNRTIAEVKGSMHYNYQSLLDNKLGFTDLLLAEVYQNKVATPSSKQTAYTIDYVLNEGSGNFNSSKVNEGGNFTLPQDVPTRAGHGFLGWYLDADLTVKAPATLENIRENMTLYAKWIELNEDTFYEIEFVLNGGQGNFNSATVKAGETYTLPTDVPTKEKFNFLGWYLDESLTQKAPAALVNVNDNVKLYAKWEEVSVPAPKVEKYKVVYELNGGTGDFATMYVNSGEQIAKPSENPTRAGYKFVGWFTHEKGGTEISFPLTVSSDVILYAQWEKNKEAGSANNDGNIPSTGDESGIQATSLFLILFSLSVGSICSFSVYKKYKQTSL